MPPTSPLGSTVDPSLGSSLGSALGSTRLDRRRLLLAAGAAIPLAGLPGLLDPAQAVVDQRAGRLVKVGARSSRALTTSGLYSYPQDYLANRAQMRGLGAPTLRLANADMDDATWAAAQEDGYDTHLTLSTEDRADFPDDASFIANHLAGIDTMLRRWPFRWLEIFNEPNFSMWWDAAPEDKQRLYGTLLVAAYRHVKANYPGTGVIGFAAGGSSAAAPGFIRGVLEAVPEAATSFDVLSMHPYIAPVAPEETKHEDWGSWNVASQVRDVRRLGVTKPIWFSEVGWEIGQSEGGAFARERTDVVSAEQQAAYTARMFVLAMRLGVERVHHMYVIDTDNFNGGFFAPGGARPQARAMAFQQRVLDQPSAVRRLGDNHSDRHVYRIRTANGPVVMAWSDSGGSVQVGRGAVVRDLYGNEVKVRRGRVRISTAPVYVTNL